MNVIYERCAGLDVHKKTVTTCVLLAQPSGRPVKVVQTFATMTADLRALRTWLQQQQVTHVAMESTGVYWKPVWNLLEDAFGLLLVNPAPMKAVPGRKTDVKDAEWIADLLQHGVLQGSFVPKRSAEVNRLQKTLEGDNIKLGDVVSDVTGVSAQAMLSAMVAGQIDPEA